ncbi:glycosyltransferase family 2 protein [Polyangium sp. 15x6]|uniref:glycosyltransferase family 2 protein n=1 Tax=Polyangium sp. 15x6 TaxID=3042687 RepID=UPI00249C4711|nr:glycosyltransferase family 2 protein [Polyangium sp. 15x6]MDI3289047.1 glycosyltransferase family 2 protein [Polyangium sp. 15x6]
MNVSVILAAYNEAGTIERVVRGCMEHTPGLCEVIVIDDGSHDGTGKLAEAAGAKVERFAKNRGKGAAVRRGIELSRGDLLLFLDADGQDDPREIPALLGAFEPGVDMVVGSRFLGRFGEGAITPLNRAGNQLLTGIVNALFRAHLTDTQAGFRAVRRTAAERARLSANRYDIEVDLLLSVLRSGARVVEVPVSRTRRDHGASSLHSFRDGTRILLRILRKRLEG